MRAYNPFPFISPSPSYRTLAERDAAHRRTAMLAGVRRAALYTAAALAVLALGLASGFSGSLAALALNCQRPHHRDPYHYCPAFAAGDYGYLAFGVSYSPDPYAARHISTH